MLPYDIYIAYISWGADGKHRPILFLEETNGIIKAFRITSKYEDKSKNIKAHYFKINDWQQSGLSKQSYIDIGEKVRIPLSMISPKSPIGRLSATDKQRLLELLY